MRSTIYTLKALFITSVFLMNMNNASGHCEIPCGIYGDSLRVTMIYEHITTIEKSMNMITELSKEGDKNYNQLVRWIVNKEEHAIKIQDIVSQYFLHQRIKLTNPGDKDAYRKYTKQLVLLHELSVFAMKAKQTTDLDNIKKMRDTLAEFEKSYFHDHSH
jgi:nickel superoxide dismutase